MSKNKLIDKFICFYPIFLALTLIGFFLGAFLSIFLFLYTPLGGELSKFEKISIIINIFVFFTSVVAVIFAVKTFRRQREHWLNESFIRHEAEVLIRFREELQKAFGAINFFFQEILEIDRKFAFNPLQMPVVSNPPLISYEKIANEFNNLVDLNSLYNSYQHLCKKHRLSQGMECISILLECVRNIPEKNIEFYKLSESETLILNADNKILSSKDTLVVYRMDPKVANSIICAFNFFAYSIFLKDCQSAFSLDALNEQHQKDQMVEFEKFKTMVKNSIYKMISDLDKVTTYWDGSNNIDLIMNKSMRFFQKKI